ncbi:Uncharacterised protein [Staphylococcus hyicus]|nr:Uncharacterised protein [Staphylococcus hyicus]
MSLHTLYVHLKNSLTTLLIKNTKVLKNHSEKFVIALSLSFTVVMTTDKCTNHKHDGG